MKHLIRLIASFVAVLTLSLSAHSQTGLALYSFQSGTDSSLWKEVTTTHYTFNGDEAVMASVQSLGINFDFCGTNYMQWSANSNGIVRLGATKVVTGGYANPLGGDAGSNLPKLVVMGNDGFGVDGLHYAACQVFGTYPNRVAVIEYCNGTYNTNTRNGLYKCQLQLSEADNSITWVFPPTNPPVNPGASYQMGAANDANDFICFDVVNNRASVNTTVSQTQWPTAGRYYRIAPPACFPVTNIRYDNVTTASAKILWSGNASKYKVEIGTSGFMQGTGTVYFINSTDTTITGLMSNAVYDVYISAICGQDTSITKYLTFSTLSTIDTVSVPYVTGFEFTQDYAWRTLNGPNYWVTGSATKSSGSRSLYITNDGGSSNQYGITKLSYSYAMRTIDMSTPGEYVVAFDWKCAGESTNDYLRAFLVPASQNIAQSSANGITATNTPSGWINVGTNVNNGNVYLNQSGGSYNRSTTRVNLLNGGVYKLVFYWYNNASGGSQPPASIDNLSVTRSSCPSIHNLTLDSNGTNRAKIKWDRTVCNSYSILLCKDGDALTNCISYHSTGTSQTLTNLTHNTWYTVYIWSNCSQSQGDTATLTFRTDIEPVRTYPYCTDFEDGDDQAWDYITRTGSTTCNNRWEIGSAKTYRGEKALYVTNGNGYAYDNSYTATYAYREFVISEAGQYSFSFDWTAVGQASYDYMRVFLIPQNTTLPVGRLPNNSTFSNANINNFRTQTPTGWIDVGGGALLGNADWKHRAFDYTFTAAQYGTWKLAFVWICNTSTVGATACIENVRVGKSKCPSIQAFTIDSLTGNYARIHWTGTAVRYDIEYDTMGFTRTRGNFDYTYDTIISLVNLMPRRTYDMWIYGRCANGTTDTVRFSFNTGSHVIQTYPYFTGFEGNDDNDWEFLSSNATNRWRIGGGVSKTDTAAMFISNNNQDFAYSDLYTVAYAYHEFNVPDGTPIGFQFDWRCTGHNPYDYMRVFAVPNTAALPTTTLPNGAALSNNSQISAFRTAIPTGWVDLYGGPMYSQSTWKHFQKDTLLPSTGIWRLVFVWVCNNSTHTTPAAVDNVRLTRANCPSIVNLTYDSIIYDRVVLTWDSSRALGYTIEYDTAGFRTGTGNIEFTNEPKVTLYGFKSLTYYDIRIVSSCLEGQGDTLNERFLFPISEFPYYQGFDDPNKMRGWNFTQNAANQWVRGNAVSRTNRGSLYVSADNGTTCGYSNTYASAYAWNDITVFDTMPYVFTFDWFCQGQTYYDYLRVFLVPYTTVFNPLVLPNGNALENQTYISSFRTAVPTKWIDLYPSHTMFNQTVWTTHKFQQTFTPSEFNGYHLLFFWVNNASNNYTPAIIDNLKISHPMCHNIENLVATRTTTTTARIDWDNSAALYWKYEWDTIGFQQGTGHVDSVRHNYIDLTGLQPGTEYELYIFSHCAAGNSDTTSITFVTVADVAELPYRTGFERGEDVAWTYVNPTDNQWHYGEATAKSSQRALYISNDNGATHQYTVNKTQYAWAYRRIHVKDSGRHVYNFDWIANGQTTYDYMRLFLVPDNVNLNVNTNNGVTTSNVTPNRWTNLVTRDDAGTERVYLSATPQWEEYEGEKVFTWADTGVYKLVAYWVNNASIGNQPPGGIDNVQFYLPTCPRIEKVYLDSATNTDIYMHWDPSGNESMWELQYRDSTVVVTTPSYHVRNLNENISYDFIIKAICSSTDTSRPYEFTMRTACMPVTIPYDVWFDDLPTGYFDTTTIPNTCWNNGTINEGTKTVNNFPYTVNFLGSPSNYIRMNSGAYIVTPNVGVPLNQLELTLWLRAENDNAFVQIGYLDNSSADVSHVVIFDTLRRGPAHELTSMRSCDLSRLPASASALYVGTTIDGSARNIWLDRLRLDYPNPCPYVDASTIVASYIGTDLVDLQWDDVSPGATYEVEIGPRYFTPGNNVGTTLTTNFNGITINNLIAGQPYQVYVKTTCSVIDTALNSIPFGFTTQCDSIRTYPRIWTFDDNITIGSESNDDLPPCWARDTRNTTPNNKAYRPQVFDRVDSTKIGNGYFCFNALTYVTLPPTSLPLDTIMITFKHTTFDTTSGLVIGTVSHENNGFGTTFTPIDTIYGTQTGTNTRIITRYLFFYQGTEQRIAFHNIIRPGHTGAYSHHEIDSLVVNIIPPCMPVLRVFSDTVWPDAVALDWTEFRPGNQWVIEYDTTGFPLGTGHTKFVTHFPDTITGLEPAQEYDFYVRTDCGANGQSVESEVYTVLTGCGPLRLPYHQNFNKVVPATYNSLNGQLPPCWESATNGSLGQNAYYMPHVLPANGSYNYTNDGTQALYIGAQSSNADNGSDKYVVLPYFRDSVHYLKLKMYYRMQSSAYGRLEVGYVTSDDYVNSFVPVQQMTSATSMRLDSVSFSEVPRNAQRIAFRWYNNNTTGNYCVGIDNVTVTSAAPPPECPMPEIDQFTFDSTYSTITLTWPRMADSAELIASPTERPLRGVRLRTSDTTYTITGLMPDSLYYIGFRTKCINGVDNDYIVIPAQTGHLECNAPSRPTFISKTFNNATIEWVPDSSSMSQWDIGVTAISGDGTDSVYRASTIPFTITGLIPQVTYRIRVRSRCGDYNEFFSGWGDTIVVTTESCDPISNINISNIHGTYALATWNEPQRSNNKFIVTYGPYEFGPGTELRVDTIDGRQYMMSNLEPYSLYDVYVAHYCGQKISSLWSSRVTYSTENDEGNEPQFFYVFGHSNDEYRGTVNGNGVYQYGSMVTLSAEPVVGNRFCLWSDGLTSARRTFAAQEDVNLIAFFAPTTDSVAWYNLIVRSSDEEMGTTSGTGVYRYGTRTTITAEPKPGYYFLAWNDGNTSPSREVTITSNMVYLATFTDQEGITDIEAGRPMVTVYPNPTSGVVNVSLRGVEGSVSVKVMDINGRLVGVRNGVGDKTMRIDLSNQSQGTYMVHIVGDVVNTVRRIVVR